MNPIANFDSPQRTTAPVEEFMLSQYVCLPTRRQGRPLLEGTTLIPQEPMHGTRAVESPLLVGVSTLGIKFYPRASESTQGA